VQSIHRDLRLDQVIVWNNEQHKQELQNHAESINLMKQELQDYQDDQDARDGKISELQAMVETLMRQVIGKGKASDLMPEGAGASVGNPLPPPRQGAAGAPGGGDPDGEGEGSGRKLDESWKERLDERPAPQPEADDDVYDENQLATLSRVMADAIG